MLGVSHKHNVKMTCFPRLATPVYDVKKLHEAIDNFVIKVGIKRCFDLGAYHHINVSGGANGAALLHCQGLVTCLLGVSKFALFKVNDLKQSLVELANTYSGLNQGKQDNFAWATSLSERIMVVLNHLRRLKNSDVRLRQACRKLDIESQTKLSNLVQSVGVMDARVEKNDGPQQVDTDAVCGKGLMLDDIQKDIQNSLPVPPSKTSKELPATDVPKPAGKSTAKCFPAKDISFIVTYASNQSYIQYKGKDTKEKKLLIAVSAKQCGQHKRIVKVMYNHFLKNPTTDKSVATSLRAALIG